MDYSELCIKLKKLEREYHAACLKRDWMKARNVAIAIDDTAKEMRNVAFTEIMKAAA